MPGLGLRVGGIEVGQKGGIIQVAQSRRIIRHLVAVARKVIFEGNIAMVALV